MINSQASKRASQRPLWETGAVDTYDDAQCIRSFNCQFSPSMRVSMTMYNVGTRYLPFLPKEPNFPNPAPSPLPIPTLMQAVQNCTTTKLYLSAALSEFDTQSASMLDEDPLARGISDPNEDILDPLRNSCCICYNEYSFANKHPRAEDPVQLTCGHILGATCIARWLETNSTCPLCRAQLRIQNDVDQALDDSLSYSENFSWRRYVDFEEDSDGESEAELEQWFDSQDFFFNPLRVRRAREEDIWLNVAWEEYAPLYTPIKSRFTSVHLEPDTISLKNSFDELTNCHEQWMADALYDEESEDKDAIGFYDVFPY